MLFARPYPNSSNLLSPETPTVAPSNILVVDDEAPQAQALCDILNLNGYAATGCTSGAQALEVLARGHYDLLMSDLMMPKMDGITLIRAALTSDPALVVLIMTGAGTIKTAVEAMKAGALDVILKPFKGSEILLAVTRALNVRELRADNVRLRASLNERTIALEASNQSLATANHGLERMLAIVSHDMRAPLQGIRACIDMLTDRGEVTASGLPLCSAIQTEASRLVDLATDLIDVSRISRGQMPWHWDGIDPHEVVAEVVAAMQGVAVAAKVRLTADTIISTTIRGDGSACRRLLINLISNAIRHAHARTITVSAVVLQAHMRFIVADDGRGIDPTASERLGRPFAISGETSTLGGVGLGLAICLGIADAHGGQITIHSRLGKGTRVTVDLRGDLDQPRPAREEVRANLDLL